MDHLYELITTFLDSNEVSENRDPEILVLTSKVLGHLDRSGGAMTADEVERQVKVALEWLRDERIEYRRFAAVLILKVQLAYFFMICSISKNFEAGFCLFHLYMMGKL
ncbi:serine/threonine-protein kinase TOR-like [Capsicum annuum]|uniref:serine/threonine-protein kinase TOR-like n=1 Tax=Capsicum annuum TaxID=4072 RepID=UPI001FB18E9E|nr:serine/threonine-protein kinase TOR-like [Capsicum annuum]